MTYVHRAAILVLMMMLFAAGYDYGRERCTLEALSIEATR
jgi:hypothetical protein